MLIPSSRIERLCRGGALLLPDCPSTVDPEKLLLALAEVESQFGQWCVPRFEPAFNWRGPYAVAENLRSWGSDAACSWGPWQVMFATAQRFLPEIEPRELNIPETNLFAACAYLRDIFRRMREKGQDPSRHDLDEILDSYNSGNHLDRYVPEEYIKKGRAAYQKHGGNL